MKSATISHSPASGAHIICEEHMVYPYFNKVAVELGIEDLTETHPGKRDQ